MFSDFVDIEDWYQALHTQPFRSLSHKHVVYYRLYFYKQFVKYLKASSDTGESIIEPGDVPDVPDIPEEEQEF